MIITIDGPAGSGKSTVSKKVARSLGFSYLDTGAMYRAVTYEIIARKIDLNDRSALIKLLDTIKLSFVNDKIHINSEDRSGEIREPEIDTHVSAVSALPLVREKLVKLQQHIGEHSDIVADGRDMGSTVFPHADFKFYLDASPEIRAHRRFLELQAKGHSLDLKTILEELIKRDNYDMSRKISPLIVPPNAVVIDTGRLTIEEVCSRIIAAVRKTPAV